MAFISPRMSLKVWNSGSDPYNHEQLADNFLKLDQHDHSSGRGVQIGGDGIRNGAITTEHILPGSLGPELFENEIVHTSLAALTPLDGDEVFFQTAAMATDGIMWRLRYNEASADAFDYKWEFIGGSSWLSAVSGSLTKTTTAVEGLTSGPSMTVSEAGLYIVSTTVVAKVNAAGSNTLRVQPLKDGAALGGLGFYCASDALAATMLSKRQKLPLTAGSVLTIGISQSVVNSAIYTEGMLELIPIKMKSN